LEFQGFTLREHQIRAIKFATERKFSLLNYWVGTGKTLIGGYLLSQAKNPVLIRMSGQADHWEKVFSNKENTLTHALHSKNNSKRLNDFKDVDLVVVDECHKFKNPDSKSVQQFFNFLNKHSGVKVVYLTGTPMTIGLEDLCTYFIIASELNNNIPKMKSAWDFKHTYLNCTIRTISVRGGKTTFREWGGLRAKYKDTFMHQLNTFMLSQDGEILNLPTSCYNMRVFQGSKFINPEYNFFVEQKQDEASVDPSTALRIEKLKQDIGKEKIYNDFKKVILLTKFIPTLEHLKNECSDLVYPTVIHGGTKNREAHILSFKLSKKYKFMAGTYKTLGVGFNLQFTNALVLLDFPYTSSDLGQGLGRIRRTGQEKVCHYFSYLYKNTDARVVNKLMKRDKNFESIGTGYATEYLKNLNMQKG